MSEKNGNVHEHAPAGHDDHPPEPTPPKQVEQHDGHQGDGMVEMARANERAHLAPAPGAVEPVPDPFPPDLFRGLGFGLAGGALVEVVMGALLLYRVLVVPGWEQLYSLAPGAFGTFWTGIGAAAGLLIGGLGSLLVTPAGDTKGRRSGAASSPQQR